MYDVSEKLRNQTVYIIDNLVNEIAPGYLLPNPYSPFDYRRAIYKRIYEFLWEELGRRQFDYIDYREEIFDLLRQDPSDFFNAIEYLLKEMYRIVHIQKIIPDDILLNPHAGNELWSRKESVRDGHIRCFRDAVDKLNSRLSQNNAEYRYDLGSGFVQMVRRDTGLDVPEENNGIPEPNDNQTSERHRNQKNSGIRKPDDNQTPEYHQVQSRSEFWNKRNYTIAVVLLIFTVLGVLFGNGLLIPPLRWAWSNLPAILEDIVTWFR